MMVPQRARDRQLARHSAEADEAAIVHHTGRLRDTCVVDTCGSVNAEGTARHCLMHPNGGTMNKQLMNKYKKMLESKEVK